MDVQSEFRDSASSSAVESAYYTICPVFVASNVAVELGWLDEEFSRIGAQAIYLRSLPNNAGWLPHYRHSLPNLFRDGGAIPTIHARADLTETYLVATTFTQTGGKILVRSDSGIHRVADLKGRPIGLPRSLNKDKIDFTRITAQRGILLALGLAGLRETADVAFTISRSPLWMTALSNLRNTTAGRITSLTRILNRLCLLPVDCAA